MSELERLQAALPQRYTLIRELDRGGMSRVYLARESLPDREVAIKSFDAQLSARLGRERFIREVEFTSKLSHPYIVPIHAAGDAGGALYYVMPYIRGESLRDRLDREGAFPVDQAVRIAQQVADALNHAHEMGIVHRDIKPSNILFQSGHAVVADFGIARALRAAETGELTLHGIAVGTPDYMSPEQAGGSDEIDGRTDTYALGCLLFEMLTGAPPFHARTPQATLARHLTDDIPSMDVPGGTVPEAVERAVRKALAKAPDDRHASTADFAAELRDAASGGYAAVAPPPAGSRSRDLLGLPLRIAGVLLVVAALGLAWSSWAFTDPTVAVASNRWVDSVAMMPLQNRTGDPTLDGLGQSLADEVNHHLAEVQGVKVIGSYSVMALWEQQLGHARLLDTLNVGHLIDGFYRLQGDSLVVTVQEVDPEGAIHDDRRYTLPLDRLDSAQLGLAHDVARRFLARIGILDDLATADEAYGPARDAYLAGNSWLGQRTAAALRRAATQFNQSIRVDPTYAPAHASLSTTYALALYYKYDIGLAAYDLAARAFAAADRAIALDPELADGYSARALITGLVEADVGAAQADFERAVQLAPNNANGPSWSSRILAQQGRAVEAYAESRRARDLDPFSAGRRMSLASLAFQLGDYDVVVEESEAAIGIQPDLVLARAYKARGLAMLGRVDECLASNPGVYRLVHALCLQRAGRVDEARAVVTQAEAAFLSSGMGDADHLDEVALEDLAGYYGLVGDAERAREWVVRAFERSPTGIDSKILDSELFAGVRADPAFKQAVATSREQALRRIQEARRLLAESPL